VKELSFKSNTKAGRPLEKLGVLGAFCRTYTITDAIEMFLSDVYEPSGVEGRYSYREGSTAAGLVLYEDKYAYSHHGTDPVSGKLCNAFDLVRIHKFGLKDEDARKDTPINKLPSYVAMTEFATLDKKVRIKIGSETLLDARGDFDAEPSDDPENDDWTAELEVDRKGNYYSTIDNVVLILKHDPVLKKRFAKNLFEKREVALRDLPWRKVEDSTKYITDQDEASVRHYLEKTYGITGIQKIQDALGITFTNNSFHPVRDYLKSLQWDSEERIDTLLIDYLGAEDNEYVRSVTRKTLVAAVARVFNPGTKFDYVLTLVGKQGIGKSSLINKLGKSWYSDSFNTIQGKEAFEQIQGVWLIEIGELAGLKKVEMEHVKHFISKREDRYRVAYGRRIENFPRQCVFFGTTNSRDFLRDPTGNRRFWPVSTMEAAPTKDVFSDLTSEEIDQVWAEAVVRFKAGEKLYLSKHVEDMAFEKQVEHAEKDDRIGIIQKYLDTKVPANWEDMSIWERRSFLQGDDELQAEGVKVRDQVCIAEIWCELFGGQVKEITSFNTKDLHTIMQNMEGWYRAKSNKRFKIYGLQRAYCRVKIGQKSVNADVNAGEKSVNAVNANKR
jgi:putative DNA primase/helicase